MPRRDVVIAPGECYHVYNRGCNRQPIFFEPENYLFFLRELKSRCRLFEVQVLAWCLMPNHFHLLVCPQTKAFADMMQSFGTSYTKAINKRMGRTGTLFEGRYEAKHVTTSEYIIHLSRYLHLNPVNAELVERPQDWAYSSYRDYLGLRTGTLALPERVLREFATIEQYRLFVESGMRCPDPIIAELTIDEE